MCPSIPDCRQRHTCDRERHACRGHSPRSCLWLCLLGKILTSTHDGANACARHPQRCWLTSSSLQEADRATIGVYGYPSVAMRERMRRVASWPSQTGLQKRGGGTDTLRTKSRPACKKAVQICRPPQRKKGQPRVGCDGAAHVDILRSKHSRGKTLRPRHILTTHEQS